MAPLRAKQCCVPYCKSIQGQSNKQFFRIGANLEEKNKWRISKSVALPKSQALNCCQDHFDLPNDAVNFIRYKYWPGTKLKLRPDTLPHKKLPINVCRLCLNLIYNGEDMVDLSENKGAENAKILMAVMPEIDLSITSESAACMKCFAPLERFYRLKQTALRTEVVVVNCIRDIAKRSPKKLAYSCNIDLFEEYNDIRSLLEKEKEKATCLEEQGIRRVSPKNDSQEEQEESTMPDESGPIQMETSDKIADDDETNVNEAHDLNKIGDNTEYLKVEVQEDDENAEIVYEIVELPADNETESCGEDTYFRVE